MHIHIWMLSVKFVFSPDLTALSIVKLIQNPNSSSLNPYYTWRFGAANLSITHCLQKSPPITIMTLFLLFDKGILLGRIENFPIWKKGPALLYSFHIIGRVQSHPAIFSAFAPALFIFILKLFKSIAYFKS